jgi:NAD(P)-dependent dehydrogenase (short-subunit alcohol dehydrogenase family)
MMHRIETPFGFYSTADEVVAGIDLSGKRAIVTGSSSGIGIETARVLAAAGAEVTLAVRNTDAGARVAADITAPDGGTSAPRRYRCPALRYGVDALRL